MGLDDQGTRLHYPQGQEISVFSKASRLALGNRRTHVQCVQVPLPPILNLLIRAADCSALSRADVEQSWTYISNQHVLVAWFLLSQIFCFYVLKFMEKPFQERVENSKTVREKLLKQKGLFQKLALKFTEKNNSKICTKLCYWTKTYILHYVVSFCLKCTDFQKLIQHSPLSLLHMCLISVLVSFTRTRRRDFLRLTDQRHAHCLWNVMNFSQNSWTHTGQRKARLITNKFHAAESFLRS